MAVEPFELRIELKTPVVMGRHPLRLEGLLWHCLLLDTGCPDQAQASIEDYLVFNGLYYHASSAAFGVVREQRVELPDPADGNGTRGSSKKPDLEPDLIAVTRCTSGCMTRGDLHECFFKSNGKRKGRYIAPVTVGGPFRDRLNEYRAYWADNLVFHGVGKGGAVAELLGFYLACVGVNASIGFGTIGQVVAAPSPSDFSVLDSAGRPARPIPVNGDVHPKNRNQTAVGDAALIPPFGQQSGELCYMPDKVRIQHQTAASLQGALA